MLGTWRGASMACRGIFDNPLDIVHVNLGAFTRAIADAYPMLALTIFAVYVIYEVVTGCIKNDCPHCDIVEFIIGYVLGDLAAHGLHNA